MEFLDPVLKFVGFIWDSVSRQIHYARNVDRKLATLLRDARKLHSRHDDIQAQVQDAAAVGKTKVDQVENWLKDVDDILRDVALIESDFMHGGNCGNGYFPDLRWRLKLGKKVVKKMKVVEQLLEEGVFANVAESPRRPLMPALPVPSHLEQQSTSQETLKEIEEALSHEETGVVCVCGMGGVGKTTIMKSIYNRLRETQHFNVVIWVTVSKDLNLNSIQEKIGNKLKVKFHENEGIEDKKDRLYARLRDLRYMLLIDDLWQAFSLNEVGIPHPGTENGCKITITTRSIPVSSEMEALNGIRAKTIHMNTLTSKEAWDLFCSKTGEMVLLPEIQPIAEELVKECGGLPLAIATVGGAMRRKDKKGLWENALRALRNAMPAEIPGMEQKVFLPLKLSYEYLEDPKIRSCFLYCSLYPEDWVMNINELLRHWICEGLIDDVDSLEEAFNKGLDILDRLRDACLLESAYENGVKMHDLLRDLAIYINSPSSFSSIRASKFLEKYSKALVLFPEEENWEGVGRISLMSSDIKHLQIIPNYPDLISLFLCCNRDLRVIHSGFFQLMPQLRILDLSHTSIGSLPLSLSHLVNLRALILTYCRDLVKMPPLGELKQLQILDLSRTGIEELPEGISNLVKLMQLDLSDTRALNRIPRNVISVLTCLEDLRLWGAEEMQVATWREVTALTRLAYLHINVTDLNGFTSQDMGLLRSFSNLKRFCVYLGVKDQYFYDDEIRIFSDSLHAENSLTIRGCGNFPEGIEGLISHVECLKLSSYIPVCLSQIIGYSETLKKMYVDDCEGVRCIIDWREVKDTNALDCLTNLVLQSLPSLENIFYGGPPLPSTRFQRLQNLFVAGCPKLSCVFSSSMVGHLHQLKQLSVIDCEGVGEIVQGDILPDNALQRLSFLDLSHLPKLTSICRQLPVLKSMEEIYVDSCPELKKLPPLCSAIQRLEGRIEGQREWWERMEWGDDDHSKSIYSTLYTEEEQEDEEDALEPDQSFCGQRDYAGSEDESVHPLQPLYFSTLPGRREDESINAIQPRLLPLFPGRGEDELVHAIQPLSMPLLTWRGEDELVHDMQSFSLSLLTSRGEDELVHDILPRPFSLLPGRGREDELVHATQPLCTSFLLDRREDESFHAIQPHLTLSPGRGEDELVHDILSRPLSFLPGRAEDVSVHTIHPPPVRVFPGRGADELVHDILSRPLSFLSGRGEDVSVHTTQPPFMSVLPGRGEDELVNDILSRPLSFLHERRDDGSVHTIQHSSRSLLPSGGEEEQAHVT